MSGNLLGSLALVMGLALACDAADAYGPYQVHTELKAPGAFSTWAADVNDAGVVVGSADGLAFIYAGGAYTTFAHPNGASGTAATGITATGTVVGSYFAADGAGGGATRGFLLSGGSFTDYTVPGAVNTDILQVSDNGRYLTGVWDVGAKRNGFVHDLQTGARTDFLSSENQSYIVQGVNNAGLVTGTVYNSTGSPSFVYDIASGQTTEYPTLVDINRPRFRDINDNGLVAGFGGGKAYVSDLDSLQVISFALLPELGSGPIAYGLNNTGAVVGYSTDPVTLASRSWIASAVPEPMTWALWSLGLFGLGGWCRRQRIAVG